jgi:LysM repeat protein
MDKLSADISTSANSASSTTPAESRTLRDVVYNSKRSGGGGNYGSLAKSQIQPTYYVSHNVEPDDTLQRLALKYSINVCHFFNFYYFY